MKKYGINGKERQENANKGKEDDLEIGIIQKIKEVLSERETVPIKGSGLTVAVKGKNRTIGISCGVTTMQSEDGARSFDVLTIWRYK